MDNPSDEGNPGSGPGTTQAAPVAQVVVNNPAPTPQAPQRPPAVQPQPQPVPQQQQQANGNRNGDPDDDLDQSTPLGRAIAAERRRLRRQSNSQIRQLQDRIAELEGSDTATAVEVTNLRNQLAALQPIQQQAQEYETTLRALVTTGLEQLSPGMRELFPSDLSLEKQVIWIDKAKVRDIEGRQEAPGSPGPNPPPAGDVPIGTALSTQFEAQMRQAGDYSNFGRRRGVRR
jgi:hypothetical protein